MNDGALQHYAAVVKRGYEVSLTHEEGPPTRLTVAKVENVTPKAGRITWTDTEGGKHEVGSSELVTIHYQREED